MLIHLLNFASQSNLVYFIVYLDLRYIYLCINCYQLLNVSQTCPNHFEGHFVYKCIPVEDSGAEDISIYFSDAIEFIGESFCVSSHVSVCHIIL